MHPRERRILREINRRHFLRNSATAALGVSSAGALLAACGGDGAAGIGAGAGLQLATPENPATLELFDDNPAIESNLEPEPGPLKIFNWDQYLYISVMKDFAREFGVEYEITSFYNMSQAMQKLRTGQFDFDVFFPTIDFLPRLVAGKLLQPLNLDYIPNLETNVWPSLANPFYDQESRYTVPYVVYNTGIGWRVDQADTDIAGMENPYDIFWDPQYKGKIGIYDDYREAITMVLLRNGVEDVNTGDQELIDMAEQQLIEMSETTDVRTTIDGAYSKLPEGQFAIHQGWSGDLVAAPQYFPDEDLGDPRQLLRYWWPTGGTVGNDLISVLKGAKNPVLAHMFLNYLLDNEHAVKNFSWVGYQPPLQSLNPTQLVSEGLVVPNLRTAIVEQVSFDGGKRQLALPPEVDLRWQRAWSTFKSGV